MVLRPVHARAFGSVGPMNARTQPTRGRGPYGLTAAQITIARRNLAVDAELQNGKVLDVRL